MSAADSLAPDELAAIFREMATVSSDVFWVVDDSTGRTIFVSPAYERLWGHPPEAVVADPRLWSRGVHPEDRERADREFRQRRRTCAYDHTFRVVRPDGSVIWVRDRGWRVRLPGRDGQLFAGIAEDVSAEVANRQHQEMVAREVDHRAKNILSVVQAIVGNTRAECTSVNEFAGAIVSRIQALGRSHELLRSTDWEGGRIADVVAAELEPYLEGASGERIVVHGDETALDANATSALGLTLHELATNAAKYGCFASPQGRLEVVWSRLDTGVRIVWEETAPASVAPPRRAGFGTALIERMFRYQLRGTVAMDYRPEGLRCELEIPAHNLVA